MGLSPGGLPSLHRNAILRGLPEGELQRVSAHLELVEVELKQQVLRPGAPIEHVYFPLESVFSFVALVDGEVVVEVGTIGPEGVVGLPVFLGAPTSPHEVFCQVPGATLRMGVLQLREVLVGDGALHRQLNRYTQAMIVQLAQNVACNRVHTTAERAARWLLMTQDRVGADRFPMTQEFLAQMLGVRRPTVSLTAGALQEQGLIRFTRGVVGVLDRKGLEDAACDCYGLLRREFDRLVDADAP